MSDQLSLDRRIDWADHYVYRIYNDDGELLYIGCSLDIKARMYEHARKSWWPKNATWTVEGPFSREVALDRERVAIFTEHPRHNVAHNQQTCRHGHDLSDAYLWTDRLGYQARQCRTCAREKGWARRRAAALAKATGHHSPWRGKSTERKSA